MTQRPPDERATTNTNMRSNDMAEHAQVDIRKGNKVVRIHSGWGIPKNVLPALRKAATSEWKTPLAIAKEFMRKVDDASFGLSLIPNDFQRDALSFYYTVDVSTMPWKVVQETCAGYKLIDHGDGTAHISPAITPARRRTLTIEAKVAAAGKSLLA
jgi:hypothetical protein